MSSNYELSMEQLINKLNDLRYKIISKDLKGRKRQEALHEVEEVEQEIKERQEY